MPISVTCASCGKRLKARDELAGKRLPCPNCGQKVVVPAPKEDSDEYLLQPERPSEEETPSEQSAAKDENASEEPAKPARPAPRVPAAPRPKAAPPLPPLTSNEPPAWLRHLHWLLALAMLPLAFSLLSKSAGRRGLRETTGSNHREAVRGTARPGPEKTHPSRGAERGQNNKRRCSPGFAGAEAGCAFLPHGTLLHWGFAAGSAVLFMTFFLLLSAHKTAEPLQLLTIGLFTATVGLVLLLLLQVLAHLSQGVWLRGGNIVVLIFYIVKLIGYSYAAVLDPENGFFLSFIGFTVGVGFCEEACKAIPLLWAYRRPTDQGWRKAFLWGLASGAGFGIAEGIMYSGDYYNGVSGPGIYLVRFLSCVALHAVWTGSVGIMLDQHQGLIQAAETWYDYLFRLVLIVGVQMTLHGLYDTLLKKEMNGYALAVAAASFLYLAYQISQVHSGDDAAAKDALLANTNGAGRRCREDSRHDRAANFARAACSAALRVRLWTCAYFFLTASKPARK